jgi:hypothetical protein
VSVKKDAKQSIEIRPEDKTVEIIMAATGVSEQQARFILAIERGEIDGDTPEAV